MGRDFEKKNQSVKLRRKESHGMHGGFKATPRYFDAAAQESQAENSSSFDGFQKAKSKELITFDGTTDFILLDADGAFGEKDFEIKKQRGSEHQTQMSFEKNKDDRLLLGSQKLGISIGYFVPNRGFNINFYS